MHENTEAPHNLVDITPNSQQQTTQYKINLPSPLSMLYSVVPACFHHASVFTRNAAYLTPPRSVLS